MWDHSEQSLSSDYLAICEAAKLKPKIIGMAESLDINSKTIQALETVLVLGVVTTTTGSPKLNDRYGLVNIDYKSSYYLHLIDSQLCIFQRDLGF